jgi:hypothetical protein
MVSFMLLKSANDNITTCSPLTRLTTVGVWSLQTLSITVFKLARASLKVNTFIKKCLNYLYLIGSQLLTILLLIGVSTHNIFPLNLNLIIVLDMVHKYTFINKKKPRLQNATEASLFQSKALKAKGFKTT